MIPLYRILFIRQRCEHCRKYLEFIERINAKLPIRNRIKIIDCTMLKYGIVEDPLVQLFDKSIKGYPSLFLIDDYGNGDIRKIKLDGINSIIETKAYLESYLNKEFIVFEENNDMFNICH